jgi:hypothetical protein
VAISENFMPAKGHKHGEDARERIARGTRWGIEKRRRIARIAPSEIIELQRAGTLSASLRPYAAQAVEESLGFIQALGGDEEEVSEQRLALVQDAARAGLMLRALIAKTLQGDDLDGDAISKIASLINTRRANLTAIGLDRISREIDLATHIEAHEACAQQPIDAKSEPVHEPSSVAATAPAEDGASEPSCPEDAGKGIGAHADSPEPREAALGDRAANREAANTQLGHQRNE